MPGLPLGGSTDPARPQGPNVFVPPSKLPKKLIENREAKISGKLTSEQIEQMIKSVKRKIR